MQIKVLTTEHTQGVYDILAECFSTPWSLDIIKVLLQSENAVCFGAFDGDVLAGYVCLEWVLDEGSLTDIATSPEQRKKGIAKALMQALLSEAEQRGLQFVTLEVRESNQPAINLYRSFGFDDVGKRPRYYKDPVEDALLMTKNIK